MDNDYRRLIDFLRAEGVEQVGHSGKTYLAHLAALYRLLKERGCPEEVCRAGMFHSIYGTEKFQGFKLPVERRPEIRALIGERAERLAYWNCAMDRPFFDRTLEQAGPPYRFRDRLTGEEQELLREDYDDLCRIHLYDWLEQVPRCRQWDYRQAAYRHMAARLGGVARESYERVFAPATAEFGAG